MNDTRIGIKEVIRSSGPLKVKAFKLLDLLLGSCAARLISPKVPKPDASLSSTRILVIRPGGIGDAVLLLPGLKTLRKHSPRCTIDVLCERRNAEVFRSQPQLINNVYVYHHPWQLIKALRNPYDTVVDTEQWHFFSAIVARLANSPWSIGFASRAARNSLYGRTILYNAGTYELNNFAALFQAIPGNEFPPHGLTRSFSIPEPLRAWAKKTAPGNNCAISLGALIPQRRPGVEQTISLVFPLLAKYDHVLLLGGSDTVTSAKKIERAINDPRLVNLAGHTTLLQSAALLESCRVTIAPDSGLMHLSCAVGTRTIGLFGPGNFAQWAPRENNCRGISLCLPCSPCTRSGYTLPTCGGSFDCIRMLQTEQIIAEVNAC